MAPPPFLLPSAGSAVGLGRPSAQKQAVEVVLVHTGVLAALLEQKTGQSRGDQPVLIPVGVGRNELAHTLEQHLRHLGFQTDGRTACGRIGGHGGSARIAVGPSTPQAGRCRQRGALRSKSPHIRLRQTASTGGRSRTGWAHVSMPPARGCVKGWMGGRSADRHFPQPDQPNRPGRDAAGENRGSAWGKTSTAGDRPK